MSAYGLSFACQVMNGSKVVFAFHVKAGERNSFRESQCSQRYMLWINLTTLVKLDGEVKIAKKVGLGKGNLESCNTFAQHRLQLLMDDTTLSC